MNGKDWKRTLERAVVEGQREHEASQGEANCWKPRSYPEQSLSERCGQTPLWSLVHALIRDPEVLLWGWQKTWKKVARHFQRTGWPEYIERAAAEWDIDEEMFEEEFFSAWHAIRDRGVDLGRVAELSRIVKVPEFERSADRTGGYYTFLRYVIQLARCTGPQDMFFARDETAKVLRCNPKTINRWVRWAVEDGILRKTAPHEAGKAGGRCARYQLREDWVEGSGITERP